MVEENKISLVSSLPERVFWNYWALPHCLLCLLFFPQATVPFTHVMITSTARVSAVQFLLSFIKKYCHVWHLGFRLYHLFLRMDHYHLSDIFDTNRKMIILAKADTRMMPFHCSVLDGDCILLPASFREHYTNEKWFVFMHERFNYVEAMFNTSTWNHIPGMDFFFRKQDSPSFYRKQMSSVHPRNGFS